MTLLTKSPETNSSIEKQTKLELLSAVFFKWSKCKPLYINKLPASGSSREYFRITGEDCSAIGAVNASREENEAFIAFSQHFKMAGLLVPEIYVTDLDNNMYLLEDLGDTTLFSYLVETRTNGVFPESLKNTYKSVLSDLLRFQISGHQGLDYTKCFPRQAFDRQSMQWDLSYFKYYFLKLADVPFNEQWLENDFNTLTDFLLSQKSDFFMFRDFQSRNIMLSDNKLYYIDYQGGRRGALQYDVASLLYDAKADIPQNTREELLDYYIEQLCKYQAIDPDFRTAYYGFVLIRIMQAMGAYGFRGFFEKKSHFLQSIPYALTNLNWILENVKLPIEIPYLLGILRKLDSSEKLSRYKIKKKSHSTLAVSITSFSYRKGLPEDPSENGGGYIFDCRSIHNPGRYDEFKTLTGKDQPVIDFFSKEPEMHEFLDHVFALVDQSVEKYEQRNFTHLMVSFGCTGGQHRSVYSAERMAEHLRQKYSVQVSLWHREQD